MSSGKWYTVHLQCTDGVEERRFHVPGRNDAERLAFIKDWRERSMAADLPEDAKTVAGAYADSIIEQIWGTVR